MILYRDLTHNSYNFLIFKDISLSKQLTEDGWVDNYINYKLKSNATLCGTEVELINYMYISNLELLVMIQDLCIKLQLEQSREFINCIHPKPNLTLVQLIEDRKILTEIYDITVTANIAINKLKGN